MVGDTVALITGATGKDGAHLADLLLNTGYMVRGATRRSSLVDAGSIAATNRTRLLLDTPPAERRVPAEPSPVGVGLASAAMIRRMAEPDRAVVRSEREAIGRDER